MRYPPEGGFRVEVVGTDLRGLTEANRAAALAMVEAASVPPSYDQAELMVARLDAGTKRRAGGEASVMVLADLYVRELMAWPLDVAQAAVDELLNGVWFPAVAELRDACRKLGGSRQATLNALRLAGVSCEPDEHAQRLELLRRMS